MEDPEYAADKGESDGNQQVKGPEQDSVDQSRVNYYKNVVPLL